MADKLSADEEAAKAAYGIYRAMKQPMTDPHWDDLSRSQRGLLEWTVRWVRMHEVENDNNKIESI